MKQLLKDSVAILEESKEKYNNAITAIDKSTSQLLVFANKITSMTTKNTEEHKAWTGKVRAAVYGTNGAVSVGLIFADIFASFNKVKVVTLFGKIAKSIFVLPIQYL